MVNKWIASDGWRGYEQPTYAVAGASDTGNWEDSPNPSREVLAELRSFRLAFRKLGFKSTLKTTKSSNAFMIKRWIVVSGKTFPEAKKVAQRLLEENKSKTQYIHGVD